MWRCTRQPTSSFGAFQVIQFCIAVPSSLVKSDNYHKELKGMFEAVKNKSDIIDRPNSEGNSPLHVACENNCPRQAALLLKKNAKLQANDQDEMPIFSLLNSNDESTVETWRYCIRMRSTSHPLSTNQTVLKRQLSIKSVRGVRP